MIVLTLLAVFAIYIIVAILVTRFFIKRARTRQGKWLKGLAAVAIFVLIPTWDAILGTIYFRYLCATEGGVRVYKVVELRPEYWTSEGKPKFLGHGGGLDEEMLGGQYQYQRSSQENYVPLFKIDKDRKVVIERTTGQPVGQLIWFLYWGGWLANSTGFHVSAASCHGLKVGLYQDFLRHIFKPKSSDY